MSIIQKKLAPFPRTGISLLPTPCHRLDRLSQETGCELWIKRDDLTGFGFGGNKTRKFDFLMADAMQKGCDSLIGIGANQSNFCRILSAVGSCYGLDVFLVLSGDKPDHPTGNLLIDHMLNATIYHVPRSRRESRARELYDELTAGGRNVYFMPPGGSTPIGTLGYAAGFDEILRDIKQSNVNIRHIIHASSSAGTQAGLVLGQAMTGWDGRITGISVDVPEKELAKDVFTLASQAGTLVDVSVDMDLVHTDGAYIGEGYGIPTPACREAIQRFASREGIFLDTVYTGKGASALLDYCAKGIIPTGEGVLFIHTGGNIQLFE
ncbi:TPA: D-cysteine desulfhydrase family protein [Candidatus Marinimicrobia bacterium]|nr:MAG: 1-aminocyclopropane-1-carboxylate deaminase [Marinimicrobia bacterium 46_47]KUK91435.1 MAG: pyridoxal-phosphate dependent protein [Marinimicrobia bacterium 46_43]HAE87275.1 D-cysteine desulfhydrase family protein [Candidatus Neomarinimicrobiota bacterium]HBY17664.1 D-cysteine desulfhydrase family protein [Candidatus Neomarinimicrobiota bacterium]